MAVPVSTRVKASEARKRSAGLVRIVRWVRADDRDAAIAALDPFTARAALPRHRRGNRIVALRFGQRPHGELNQTLRKLGLVYDRQRDLWAVPDAIDPKIIRILVDLPTVEAFSEPF